MTERKGAKKGRCSGEVVGGAVAGACCGGEEWCYLLGKMRPGEGKIKRATAIALAIHLTCISDAHTLHMHLSLLRVTKKN